MTAFTLAHSLTLALAALEVTSLPSRIVEAAIAFSVLLASLNNLFPVVVRKTWLLAFAFGLVHGFGFAGALREAALEQSSLLTGLLAFNLGVECGQLGFVLVLLPPVFWLRNTLLYQRLIFQTASAAAGLLACVWIVQRIS